MLSRCCVATARALLPRGLAGVLALVIVSIMANGASAASTTWNPTTEFSVGNGNPNGVWSYGWMDTGFTTFTPYANQATLSGASIWYGWGGDFTPSIWLNTSGATSFGVPAGALSLHPGDGHQPSVLRWTAPLTAQVRVAGQFLAGDVGVMQVTVRHNTAVLWSATDAGTFDLSVNVHAGDTIQFAVFGGYTSGNTGLQATITTTSVALPLTTSAGNKLSLGTFPAGTRLSLGVSGSGDLVDARLQTNPDGSLRATAGAPWTYANHGATYGPVAGFPAGDGVNRYAGGGLNYDVNGGNAWMFAGKQTTDTTDPATIRAGAVVGTFAASPTRADWFFVGYGGTFTVPAGGATLYVAVNESEAAGANSDNHGNYAVRLSSLPAAAVSVPLTTLDTDRIAVGTFAPGTVLQLSVTGSGEIAPGAWTSKPDGSLVTPATGAFTFANVGAAYPGVSGFPAGNGVNQFAGGGANYDHNGSGWPFAGKQTTDTTDSAAIRYGALVGTYAAAPTRNDWFQIGLGGTFTVPPGGGTLSVAVNETFAANNTGSYSVTLALVAANNDFAARSALAGASASVTASNAGGTKESGEPLHAGNAGGASSWWTWTAPKTGVVTVSTIGSSFNTLLGVYTGTAVGALVPVASDDNSGPASTSQLSFSATAGTIYQIAVDGSAGATGSITLNLGYAYQFSTFAGLAGSGGSTNGTGGAARFLGPNDVVVDGSGTVYVGEASAHTIRKITAGGVVTTLAGSAGVSGTADGTGGEARFKQPLGLALDGAGNLLVADYENHAIRRVTPTGVVTIFAGLPGTAGTANATSPDARFNFPVGLAVDASGSVFVADSGNHVIRKIAPGGAVTTFAGTMGSAGSADGTGTAAKFDRPYRLAFDGSGNLIVADTFNHTLRVITPAGVVTTLAGAAGVAGVVDGAGGAARFNKPYGVAVDPHGNVFTADYVGHTVRMVTPAGVVTTIGGLADTFGVVDGTGGNARFNAPTGIARDAGGSLFIADFANQTIRRGGLAVVPTVNAISPSTIAAGMTVTLTGSGFAGATAVSFNGIFAGSFQVLSDTTITAVLPAAATSGNVVVTGPVGASPATVAFVARPVPSSNDRFDPNANGTIHAVLVQPDGRIVIGGEFTTLQPNLATSATPAIRLARLNRDGSIDPTFTASADDTVRALALQSDGKLLVGGSFTTINTATTRRRIARLHANGVVDADFNPNASGDVHALAVQSDGRILLGGTFGTLQPGGAGPVTTRTGFARLLADGTLDALNFTLATGEYGVRALLALPDGAILVAGDVSTVNGSNRDYLFRITAGGALDAALPAAPNGLVRTLARQVDGKILLGGEFSAVGGVNSALVRLNSDLTLDAGFNPAVPANVHAIAPQADGRIVIGGTFTTAGGQTRRGLARLRPDGSLDAGYVAPVNSEAGVYALGLQPDGSLVAAGDFTLLATHGRGRIARVLPDGSLERALIADTTGGVVGALAVQPDGRIILGGHFTTVAGQARNYVARLNADSTLDASFNPAPDASVVAPVVLPNGQFLVGGRFNTIAGQARPGLARFNADGTIDLAFNAGISGGILNSVLLQPDGRLVIGGAFTSVGGQPRNRLARLNSDGTLDAGFNPDVSGEVFGLALQADGAIVLTGDFTTVGGQTRQRLARVSASGALEAFAPNADGIVSLVVVQPDGRVVVTGAFNSASGIAPGTIARLHADGPIDQSFSPATDGGAGGFSVAVQPDGKTIIGGEFANAGGFPRARLARLNSTAPTGTSITATATTLTLQRHGPLPELAWVTFEQSTDGVTGWTSLGTASRVGTTPNWQFTGQVLPQGSLFYVRARAAAPTGIYGASSLVEHVQQVYLAAAVVPAPTIASIAPTSVRAGDTLTLTGTNLGGTHSLRLGAFTLTTGFTINPAGTSLTVVLPAAATSGAVVVTTPGGSTTSGTPLVVAPDFTLRNPTTTAGPFDGGAAAGLGVQVLASSSGVIFASSDGGFTWTERFRASGAVRGLAFADSRFVAVGNNGLIVTSTNGLDWTPRTSGTGVTLTGIARSATLWVAVSSDATVLTSTDALTWQASTNGAAANGLAFGAGSFVAVGAGGAIRTSADGAAWTAQTSPTTQALNEVTFVNGQFVAVGNAGTLLTSPTGVTWTSRTSGTSIDLFAGVAFGAGKYLTGGANTFLTSADGATWTASLQPTGDLRSVLFDGGQFVVGGFLGRIATSPDAVTWALRSGVTDRYFRDVAYGNGRYLAVATSGSAFATSTDGASWTEGSALAGTGSSFTHALNGVAYGQGVFAAVGSAIYTTTDTTTWALRTPEGMPTLNAVAHGGGIFVAVGHGGAAYRSTDLGATWTPVNTGVSVALQSVTHGDGVFVAVGAGGTVLLSVTGASWSPATSGVTTQLETVRFLNGQFVAGGAAGTLLTSPNGATWTVRTFPSNTPTLTGLAYGDGLHLAVASNVRDRYYTSPDAVTWTAVPLSPQLFDLGGRPAVVFGNGRLAIVGGGGLLATSNYATDTFAFVTQPAGASFLTGRAFTLEVATRGASSVTLQWYQGLSGDTSAPVGGAIGAAFTTPVLTASARYWVRAIAGGVALDSATAVLLGAPAFAQHPQAVVAPERGSAVFSVVAFGLEPLTYQWSRGTSVLSGATTATLNLSNVTDADLGAYSVAITNAAGTRTSNAASLTLVPSAPVVVHPLGGFGPAIQSHTSGGLSLGVTGTFPIQYQWFKDGSPLPGGTGTVTAIDGDAAPVRFHRANWQPADAGLYTVVLSNAHGTATPAGQRLFVPEEAAWAQHHPLPSGDPFGGVGALNGQFLITGARGSRFLTADGTTYASQPSLSSNGIEGLISGGGRHLLMSGGGNYATSTDGVNWTTRHLGFGDEGAVSGAAGGGQFLLVLESGRLITSTTGETWSERTFVVEEEPRAVAFANGQFYLFAHSGKVYTSATDAAWTFHGLSPSTTGVTYLNGHFFLGDDGGTFYSSTDALTWTARAVGVPGMVGGIAFGGGLYVVVTDAGAIATSPTLSNWTLRTSGTTQGLSAITYANGMFMAVGGGDPTPVVLTSPTGETWTNRARSLTAATLHAIVANGNASLVAVGDGGAILRSTNGSTWAAASGAIPNAGYQDVTYLGGAPGAYVAVGNGGVISRSTDDGLTWSTIAAGPAATLRTVRALNGQLFAAGDNGTVLTSVNSGASWSTVPFPAGVSINALGFGKGTYVAVGVGGAIRTSTDLTNWTLRTSGTSVSLNEVAYGGNVFVVAGNGGVLLTSTDGAAWTTVAPVTSNDLNWVGYAGGVFAVAAGNFVLVSADATEWLPRYVGGAGPAARISELEVFNDRLLSVGALGTIRSGGLLPAIGQQPLDQLVVAGGTARFRVLAHGSAAPVAYQWFKGATLLTGRTNAELVLPGVQAGDAGGYSVTLTAPAVLASSVTSATATLTLGSLPDLALTTAGTQVVNVGQTLTLVATATGSPAPTFQWTRNGEPIPGATNASHAITSAASAQAGTYRVTATNTFASVTSDAITVVVLTSDLVVLSARSRVPAGGTSSASFTIEGTQAKSVLIRGAGPVLSGFSVADRLADPRIRLYDRHRTEIGANNDWTAPGANSPGATPIFPAGSKDAALVASLAPGTYHVVLDGADGGGGIALLQVYDLETAKPRLVMLTVRAGVGLGDDLVVVGFTIDGTLPRRLLLRAPGEHLLSGYESATSGLLVDPVIRLYDAGGFEIAEVDDWSADNADILAAAATVGAPPFNGFTLDSAMVVNLAPGSYTAELVGFANSTGESLLEIFEVDAQRASSVAPALTWAPTGQVGVLGGEVVFSAHAIGRPVATYQWRRNGLDLAGATGPALGLSNLQATDAVLGGAPVIYDVVASNAAGSVTSPPATLTLLPEFHSADSNQNHRISLFELTRVIELYNTRAGTERTGEYRSQDGSEDGFMPGPGARTHFHSSDANRDGRIDLTELTRIIELFNFSQGSERTGEYHPEVGTEDGFAAGPRFISRGDE